MFDIEANEQRELVALMRRDELPTPNEAVRAALDAAVIVVMVDSSAPIPRGRPASSQREGAATTAACRGIRPRSGVSRGRR
jgi:hypothetical protein